MKLLLILLSVCSYLWASPVPSRVKYDQRQEGDLNVRADLENFVILVIPTSPGTSASSLGLLDLLSKAIPIRGHNKRNKHVKKPEVVQEVHSDEIGDIDDETQSFIESKTAPYHVDITKARKNLAKLHPVPQQQQEQVAEQEELLVSPNLALVKTDDDVDEDDDDDAEKKERSLRVAKGFVLSMPLEVEEGVVQIDNKRIEKSKDEKEKDGKKKEFALKKEKGKVGTDGKVKMFLIGAEHDEDCGPGYERDEEGICKFFEHV